MREALRKKIAIQGKRLKELNEFLLDPRNEAINAVLDIVEKYGGPKEINRKAKQARRLSSLMKRLKESGSPYYKDVLGRVRADGGVPQNGGA
jgi:DNA-binding phage protein